MGADWLTLAYNSITIMYNTMYVIDGDIYLEGDTTTRKLVPPSVIEDNEVDGSNNPINSPIHTSELVATWPHSTSNPREMFSEITNINGNNCIIQFGTKNGSKDTFRILTQVGKPDGAVGRKVSYVTKSSIYSLLGPTASGRYDCPECDGYYYPSTSSSKYSMSLPAFSSRQVVDDKVYAYHYHMYSHSATASHSTYGVDAITIVGLNIYDGSASEIERKVYHNDRVPNGNPPRPPFYTLTPHVVYNDGPMLRWYDTTGQYEDIALQDSKFSAQFEPFELFGNWYVIAKVTTGTNTTDIKLCKIEYPNIITSVCKVPNLFVDKKIYVYNNNVYIMTWTGSYTRIYKLGYKFNLPNETPQYPPSWGINPVEIPEYPQDCEYKDNCPYVYDDSDVSFTECPAQEGECDNIIIPSNKYLYKKGGVLYSEQNGKLSSIPSNNINDTVFLKYGNDTFNSDLITPGIEVLYYKVDKKDVTPNIQYDAVLNGDTVIMDWDLQSEQGTCFNVIGDVYSDDNVRFLISNNKGTTWKTFDGMNVVNCNLDDISTRGITFDMFTNLNNNQLSLFKGGTNILRLAIYIEQHSINGKTNIDHIRLRY